ncbi:MAG: MFS transporter, partial [Candidatus Hodarchaeales archaeon]
IYAFELLNSIPEMQIVHSIFSLGVFILFITACFATISLSGTGFIIDRHPEFVNPLITGSLIMSGLSLFILALGVDFTVLILIGLPTLGFSLGILVTGAGALFSVYSEVQLRGLTYSIALFTSALISIGIILLDILFQLDFRIPLIVISILAIVCGIIFFLSSRSITPWVNDAFPTSTKHIIARSSVKVYLVSHYFVYFMLGIAFVSISKIGQLRYTGHLGGIPFLGEYLDDPTQLFWILVFLGDFLFVLPMGWLSDRIGRKNLIVFGVYGIVVAALIVGLSDNTFLYYFSAFLLGVSFSAMHPSLDSAVWSDLSPLDSVGRYNALAFISLLQGVGCGLAVALFILPEGIPSVISYVLIGVAILSLFPLFFAADSFVPLDTYLILVSMSGVLVFHHDFHPAHEISEKDLSLVAGALSAISTVFESIDTQQATLDMVRHGDVFIFQSKSRMNNKGDLVGTLFANKNDPELQKRLDSFLARFSFTFQTEIDVFIGQTSVFDDASEIVEDIFGPLLPSKTFHNSAYR